MSVLVDTNVLLRSAQPSHPLCKPATQAVSALPRRGESVFLCSQNIAEFWNVATRPIGSNGLGMSPDDAPIEVRSIEGLLELLPDSPAIYPEWKRLVKDHKVLGLKVFDARLVAIMNVYGVKSILTYNTADFTRYTGLSVIQPAQI